MAKGIGKTAARPKDTKALPKKTQKTDRKQMNSEPDQRYLLFNVFFNLFFLWLIKRLSGTWASIGLLEELEDLAKSQTTTP